MESLRQAQRSGPSGRSIGESKRSRTSIGHSTRMENTVGSSPKLAFSEGSALGRQGRPDVPGGSGETSSETQVPT